MIYIYIYVWDLFLLEAMVLKTSPDGKMLGSKLIWNEQVLYAENWLQNWHGIMDMAYIHIR